MSIYRITQIGRIVRHAILTLRKNVLEHIDCDDILDLLQLMTFLFSLKIALNSIPYAMYFTFFWNCSFLLIKRGIRKVLKECKKKKG